MKYAGNITVVDDNGEVVYERKLTMDEIIFNLLQDKRELSVIVPVPAHTPSVASFMDGLKSARTKMNIEPPLQKVTPMKPPKSKRQSNYEKEELESDIIAGEMKPSEIAKKHGTSVAMVYTTKNVLKKDGRLGEKKETPVRLTESQFNGIKRSREMNTKFSALEYANDNGLQLQQVNYAIIQHTYDDYVRHFTFQNKD